MKQLFESCVTHIENSLQGAEAYTANFKAEESDFVRFNKSSIRQAGSVRQAHLGIDLINGNKHAAGSTTLGADPDTDKAAIDKLINTLREQTAVVPEDPYLLINESDKSNSVVRGKELPQSEQLVQSVLDAGKGRDLVGILASGPVFAGFASSHGQRDWYENRSFHIDWSFYHQLDRAVKTAYAGCTWSDDEFNQQVETAASRIEPLSRESIKVKPGPQRVYLTPAALKNITGMLGWGGFGMRAHKSKQTPLLQMVESNAQLNKLVSIYENAENGVAPSFQSQGFQRPDCIPLIENGLYKNCLVSPRSSLEYETPCNGAYDSEAPVSLEMAGGSLKREEILQKLDTGIWIDNLWYLNYSDRNVCRMTGMTRFATFWVENGEIVAPLEVMRFDETVYRMLGENLIDLTEEREMIIDSNTYNSRSTGSTLLPGALIDDFRFTL